MHFAQSCVHARLVEATGLLIALCVPNVCWFWCDGTTHVLLCGQLGLVVEVQNSDTLAIPAAQEESMQL